MKKEFINKLSDLGKKQYPTPNSKYGFSIRKLALEFYLNHATLNNWLNGKTGPTNRQIKQINELIILFNNKRAAELDEDYNVDYKTLYLKAGLELKKVYLENGELKDHLNLAIHAKKDIEIKLHKKIENLREIIEKLKLDKL